ncbi:DUF262 domain-containing protein [Sphingopyxis sp.]|uniref:DUF262 domain-containing protein n=1 Tax=Sphingopyxis sp. TaxID=1908224 RepID=UPI003D124541
MKDVWLNPKHVRDPAKRTHRRFRVPLSGSLTKLCSIRNEFLFAATVASGTNDRKGEILSDLNLSDAEQRALVDAHGVEEESVDEDLDLTHPFDPSKIRVTTEPRTIDLLVRRINHGEIDLAPAFQRRARLWKLHKKGQLIESILLRIPLPVFYVSATEDDLWAVVDGLQRLTTIHDFMSDAFPLSGLEYLEQLDGMTFSKLPRPMQRRIEETSLLINIIQPGTPDEVMINIFRRLNTGGLPLTGQEIRNALYKGQVREFLAEMVATPEFISATDGRVSDDRMDAQECVLRFAAFYTNGWKAYDRNDLDAYLSEAMRQLNALPAADLAAIGTQFKVAMQTAYQIFDKDAFRKRYDINADRKPVSKALFESWSVSLAELTDAEREKLISQRALLIDKFIETMRDDRFFEVSISSSTGTVQRVHKRFGAIEEVIVSALESEEVKNA